MPSLNALLLQFFTVVKRLIALLLQFFAMVKHFIASSLRFFAGIKCFIGFTLNKKIAAIRFIPVTFLKVALLYALSVLLFTVTLPVFAGTYM